MRRVLHHYDYCLLWHSNRGKPGLSPPCANRKTNLHIASFDQPRMTCRCAMVELHRTPATSALRNRNREHVCRLTLLWSAQALHSHFPKAFSRRTQQRILFDPWFSTMLPLAVRNLALCLVHASNSRRSCSLRLSTSSETVESKMAPSFWLTSKAMLLTRKSPSKVSWYASQRSTTAYLWPAPVLASVSVLQTHLWRPFLAQCYKGYLYDKDCDLPGWGALL